MIMDELLKILGDAGHIAGFGVIGPDGLKIFINENCKEAPDKQNKAENKAEGEYTFGCEKCRSCMYRNECAAEAAKENNASNEPEYPVNDKSPVVYICAPYRGNNAEERKQNVSNAKEYGRYAINQGCIPFIPHIAICGFLEEDEPLERAVGIIADGKFMDACDELWVFGDNVTPGMHAEIERFKGSGKPIRRFTVG